MIRITGGEHRGRQLQAPAGLKTRPTQAKLRQALFNSIQAAIPGARILDLFAGSGSLTFEALSRGADHAFLVEQSREAARVIEANAKTLGYSTRLTLWVEEIKKSVPRILAEAPFDVVLADPPYAGGWESWLLTEIDGSLLLSEEGLLLIEWGTQKSQVSELPDRTPFLVKVREKNYGDSVLTTYQRAKA